MCVCDAATRGQRGRRRRAVVGKEARLPCHPPSSPPCLSRDVWERVRAPLPLPLRHRHARPLVCAFRSAPPPIIDSGRAGRAEWAGTGRRGTGRYGQAGRQGQAGGIQGQAGRRGTGRQTGTGGQAARSGHAEQEPARIARAVPDKLTNKPSCHRPPSPSSACDRPPPACSFGTVQRRQPSPPSHTTHAPGIRRRHHLLLELARLETALIASVPMLGINIQSYPYIQLA